MTIDAVVVPPRVLLLDRLTFPLKLVAGLPNRSSAETTRVNGLPAATGLGVGWVVTSNWYAAAATTLNGVLLVTDGNIGLELAAGDAVRVKPLPTLSRVNPVNVAWPAEAGTMPRIAPPGCRLSVTTLPL